jgi:hypothetical protein
MPPDTAARAQLLAVLPSIKDHEDRPYGTVDDNPSYQYTAPSGPPLTKHLCLTSADTAEAATELATLEKIPSASQYFATAALHWQKLHPSDSQTPDLLGEADRVLRNSCRTELPYDPKTYKPVGDPNNPMLTANLAHAIFDALHKHYPRSTWAKRYKSWEQSTGGLHGSPPR